MGSVIRLLLALCLASLVLGQAAYGDNDLPVGPLSGVLPCSSEACARWDCSDIILPPLGSGKETCDVWNCIDQKDDQCSKWDCAAIDPIMADLSCDQNLCVSWISDYICVTWDCSSTDIPAGNDRETCTRYACTDTTKDVCGLWDCTESAIPPLVSGREGCKSFVCRASAKGVCTDWECMAAHSSFESCATWECTTWGDGLCSVWSCTSQNFLGKSGYDACAKWTCATWVPVQTSSDCGACTSNEQCRTGCCIEGACYEVAEDPDTDETSCTCQDLHWEGGQCCGDDTDEAWCGTTGYCTGGTWTSEANEFFCTTCQGGVWTGERCCGDDAGENWEGGQCTSVGKYGLCDPAVLDSFQEEKCPALEVTAIYPTTDESKNQLCNPDQTTNRCQLDDTNINGAKVIVEVRNSGKVAIRADIIWETDVFVNEVPLSWGWKWGIAGQYDVDPAFGCADDLDWAIRECVARGNVQGRDFTCFTVTMPTSCDDDLFDQEGGDPPNGLPGKIAADGAEILGFQIQTQTADNIVDDYTNLQDATCHAFDAGGNMGALCTTLYISFDYTGGRPNIIIGNANAAPSDTDWEPGDTKNIVLDTSCADIGDMPDASMMFHIMPPPTGASATVGLTCDECCARQPKYQAECAAECGAIPTITSTPTMCGDLICAEEENYNTCCMDCGCPDPKVCKNGVCEAPPPESSPTQTPEPIQIPAASNAPEVTPSPTSSTLKPNGIPCTASDQCENGNCQNGVCCTSEEHCCTANKDCMANEQCDTERFYCVSRPTSTAAPSADKEEEGAFEFFKEYWELAAGALGSLGAIAYYLHILKRKTIGEEKMKVRRGVTREGNIIKIGVKIINESTFPLVDVGVELDVPKAFRIEGGSKFIDLGIIKQGEFQSAIFKLVPTRCVSGNITGSVIYHNVKNEKKMVDIEPVTVGSVCPFLEKVSMTADAFNEKVKNLPGNEKRIKSQLDPQTMYSRLQSKCSAMHAVHEGYSPDGKHYIGMYSSRGAYSKNFIGMYMDFDIQSKEVLFRVYGEQEEMITGLLSEIVEIVEEAAGMSL